VAVEQAVAVVRGCVAIMALLSSPAGRWLPGRAGWLASGFWLLAGLPWRLVVGWLAAGWLDGGWLRASAWLAGCWLLAACWFPRRPLCLHFALFSLLFACFLAG
jgi:hypothetical protein